MNTYCLKCKRQTKNLNSKGSFTKNTKYIVKKVNLYQKKMLLAFLVNYFQKYPF